MKLKRLYLIYKIFKIVLISLVLLCICFFSYYIIKRLIDKNKPSKIFGRYIVEVEQGSGSMYNTSEEYKDISLSPGDLLFIKPLKKSDYAVGMTITFYDADGIVTTHQIIRLNEREVVTKGINKENSEDAPISYDQIIGCVNKVWHGFRQKANFFTSIPGIILIVLILFGANFGLSALDKFFKKNLENK